MQALLLQLSQLCMCHSSMPVHGWWQLLLVDLLCAAACIQMAPPLLQACSGRP